jgi:hypothetical protein
MAAGHGHCVDQLVTQLVGNLLELIGIEVPKVLRRPDSIEKRRAVADGHFNFFLQNALRLA